MRIAFIGQKGIPATFGGVESHVDALSRGLAERGQAVVVYVRDWYTPRPLRAYGGVELVHLPTVHTKHLDAAGHSWLATCHALGRGFDIFHYQGIGPALWSPLARAAGRKVVATVHRLDWATEKWGPAAKAALRLGERAAVLCAHRTIAVSRQIDDHLRRRYGLEPALIPNGAVAPVVRPLEAMASRFDLRAGRYALFLGRLVPEKRPDWLVRAFLEVKRAGRAGGDFRLVVAGGSSATDRYADELRRLAEGRADVVFTGPVWGRDKEELLSNALFVALPSYLEGYPIVLLEAKSYGVAVLASDIGPHRDVVRDGRDGRLFARNSFDDLVARLAEMMSGEETARRMGRQARQDQALRPGWGEIVERTLALYRELFDRGGAGR